MQASTAPLYSWGHLWLPRLKRLPLLTVLLLAAVARSPHCFTAAAHECTNPQKPPTDPATATAKELNLLVAAYTDTPALARLSAGWIGDTQLPSDVAATFSIGVRNASHTMLRTCIEPTGLLHDFRRSDEWTLRPPADDLPRCTRRLHFIMASRITVKPEPTLVDGMTGSFRMRGLMLQTHLLQRGHLVSWYGDEHLPLFASCTEPGYVLPFLRAQTSSNSNSSSASAAHDAAGYTSVAVAVKYMPDAIIMCLRFHKVPIVMDMIDAGRDLGRTYLSKALKPRYDLLLTTCRLATMIFERNSGVPAALVYHQPPNTIGFRREDRSKPVTRVAMVHQAEHNILDNLRLEQLLKSYCQPKGIELVVDEYGGDGFSQAEMRAYALEQENNAGEQMGYAMGYSVVDVSVLWLACDRPLFICAKPVTRMLASLSLGIPTIVIGSAAYLDVAVQYGYPLVASSMEHAVTLLDMLIADQKLRQAVSQLGLRIAADFTTQRISEVYERAVCHAAEQAGAQPQASTD